MIHFFKIDRGLLGAINFNNMIPVNKSNYKEIDLNSKPVLKEDIQYLNLLSKQLKWLNNHFNLICKKSYKLYYDYINNLLPSKIKNRCCDF